MSDTPKSLSEAAANWNDFLAESNTELEKIQREIDDIAYELYGIGAEDRAAIEAMLGQGAGARSEEDEDADEDDDEEEDSAPSADPRTLVSEFLDYCLGCAYGRWDIRCATGEKPEPPEPDPFDPLPVCPPGMLQNDQGLPAAEKDVPKSYPLRISWPGILVDDPGHPEDIVTRVREAIQVMWGERAEAIEQEACDMLGVDSLRDYFDRASLFFDEHLKRHSKSRRKAPLYWPIGTAKGKYTVWLYYHRLTDQTLHRVIADFLVPKLKDLERQEQLLRERNAPKREVEEVQDLHKEITELRGKLDEVIALPWKPNLNDGVLITASPLHELFRLTPWRNALKECWKKLSKGDYDWAHLAYSIWPERVEGVCRKDRSIAIAHDLEHLCEVEAPKPKKKGRKKKGS